MQAMCRNESDRFGSYLLHPLNLRIVVISVYRCSDYIEAQLLAGLLREHGINVFLQGALMHGGIGELPAMGHLSIMVDDQDQTAAERIIQTYERGDLAIDDEHVE
jgi:Putative prokaryotic signal transducing protein